MSVWKKRENGSSALRRAARAVHCKDNAERSALWRQTTLAQCHSTGVTHIEGVEVVAVAVEAAIGGSGCGGCGCGSSAMEAVAVAAVGVEAVTNVEAVRHAVTNVEAVRRQ